MYVLEVIVEPASGASFKGRDALARLRSFFAAHHEEITGSMSDSFSCDITASLHASHGIKLTISLVDYENLTPTQESLDDMTSAARVLIGTRFPEFLGLPVNSINTIVNGYAEVEAVA